MFMNAQTDLGKARGSAKNYNKTFPWFALPTSSGVLTLHQLHRESPRSLFMNFSIQQLHSGTFIIESSIIRRKEVSGIRQDIGQSFL